MMRAFGAALAVRVAVYGFLAGLVIVFWIWLLEIAFNVNSECPQQCWCDPEGSMAICTNGSLREVPTGFHENVRHLILDDNDIAVLKRDTLSRFTDLATLSITDNQLVFIEPGTFQGLTNLKILHLSENKLRSISQDTFMDAKGLRTIHLEANEFGTVDPYVFVDMENLTYLDIGNNSDILIPLERSFLNAPSLQTLSIPYSNITALSPKTFEGMLNLEELHLQGNLLPTLDVQILETLSDLDTLYIHGNPLECDCRLLETWRWCRDHNITTGYREKVPRCASPSHVAGMWWQVLAHAECKSGRIEFASDAYLDANHTYTPAEEEKDVYFEEYLEYGQPTILVVLFVFAVIGNATVILVIALNKRMRGAASSALVLNLAAADLIYVLVNVPLYYELYHQWESGDVICALASLPRQLTLGASAFTVALLAAQRYLVTSGSTLLATTKNVAIAIGSIWFVSLVLSIPDIVAAHYDDMICTLHYNHRFDRLSVAFHLVVHTVYPLGLVAYCNYKTSLINLPNPPVKTKGRKTLGKIVLWLGGVLFVMLVPYYIWVTWFTWSYFDVDFNPMFLHFLLTCLPVLKCVLDPIALVIASMTYRRLMKRRLLCCRPNTWRLEEDVSGDSDLLGASEQEAAVRYQNGTDPNTPQVVVH